MAQFRAVIQGQRGQASRLGSKKSGLSASINGWYIGVDVYINHNVETGKDEIQVYKTKGSSYSSQQELIAKIIEE